MAPPSAHCQHQVVSRLGDSQDLTFTSTYMLLFGLAKVVAEVKVAGRFGNGRGRVWDRHVLQIQEAELDFHRKENVQFAAHAFAAHLFTQQHIESIRPQTELK